MLQHNENIISKSATDKCRQYEHYLPHVGKCKTERVAISTADWICVSEF